MSDKLTTDAIQILRGLLREWHAMFEPVAVAGTDGGDLVGRTGVALFATEGMTAQTLIDAEREACAQVAEAAAKKMGDLGRQHRDEGHEDSMDRCYARSLQCTQLAADIRARYNA